MSDGGVAKGQPKIDLVNREARIVSQFRWPSHLTQRARSTCAGVFGR